MSHLQDYMQEGHHSSPRKRSRAYMRAALSAIQDCSDASKTVTECAKVKSLQARPGLITFIH